MKDQYSVEKDGRSWVVRPQGDGWVFSKSFPTKWKAMLALETWLNGGRASDYWTAARVRTASRSAAPPLAPEAQELATDSTHERRSRSKEDQNGLDVLLGCGVFLAQVFVIVVLPTLALGLIVLVPPRGFAALALLGGLFGLSLAGVGRQGWRTSFDGRRYYKYWGRPPLSVIRALIAFVIGAVVMVSLLMGR